MSKKIEIESVSPIITFSGNFRVLCKLNLICLVCKREGLLIKYRFNKKLGFFHQSSGIILSCENWGNCESEWNKIGCGREYPWHTWLSSYHKEIDFSRGGYGQALMSYLEKEESEIFTIIKKIDKFVCREATIC